MRVRSIALFSTAKDFDVAMFEMKIVGLRELDDGPGEMSAALDEVEKELHSIMPRLREMAHTDLLMEDNARRLYLVRLYVNNAKVEHVLILSSRNTIRGLVRKLLGQGWGLKFLLERKAAAKRSYWR
ncbi:MAG: hypothetical protein TU35_000715 [Thermoproteus sp. AZ2]|jgi:hypothetical protein|uniref:Uncharacterized protein n=1 Tax=Thermoproteus sp. AZ2 TaxID=1609232 RepID=A0ACC6UY72_9CREN|nr:MAG: hypothetical protein TU35_01425 [Thermoproteus sp. AZ2]